MAGMVKLVNGEAGEMNGEADVMSAELVKCEADDIANGEYCNVNIRRHYHDKGSDGSDGLTKEAWLNIILVGTLVDRRLQKWAL